MGRYEVTVLVEYVYDVEAESVEDAEQMGWDYEDYQHFGTVTTIEVYDYQEDEEEEKGEE
jgi:hypothetical protein